MSGTARSRPHWLYWLCQFGGWGALWLAEVVELPDLESGPVYPAALFFRHLLYYGSALLFTHLWRRVIRLKGWTGKPLAAVWWRVLLGTFLLASLHNALNTGLVARNLTAATDVAFGNLLLIFATYQLLIWVEFFAWTGMYLGYHAYRQLQDLQVLHAREETARKAAALQALKAQVRPHFLFNSLNTVRALIPENPDRARDAVTHLAHLLRASLDTHEAPLIPLAREIEVVAAYLELEQMRFEERLQIDIDIAPDTLTCLIPPFVLQTLVENAIKHGIERLPAGGLVRVVASRLPGDLLQLRISNPGQLAPQTGGGQGLANARERLRLLGGESAGLTVVEVASRQEVVATAIFPQPARLSPDSPTVIPAPDTP